MEKEKKKGGMPLVGVVTAGIFTVLASVGAAWATGSAAGTTSASSEINNTKVSLTATQGELKVVSTNLDNNTKNDDALKAAVEKRLESLESSITKNFDTINDKLDTLNGWNRTALPAN